MAARLVPRALALGVVVSALLGACGVEQPAGRPSVELVVDDITWVSTDGYDGAVRALVKAKEDARSVVVEADVDGLLGQGEVTPGENCALDEGTVTCRVGDVAAGDDEALTLMTVAFEAGADVSDGYEVPLRYRTRASRNRERRHVVHPARGPVLVSGRHEPQLDLAAGAEVRLRPALLNVGSAAAEGAHLVVSGGHGMRFTSQFSNCRPVLPERSTAVCTFEQDIAPHAAVRTSAPLAFRTGTLISGFLGYHGGAGAVDPPAELGELGLAEGTAPELRLVPLDPEQFRSESGGIAAGGSIAVTTDLKTTIAAVGDTLPRKGEGTIEVGVVNRGPGVVDLTQLGVQDVHLGTFTLEVPDGVEVLDIPFEDIWADCSPREAGHSRYVCRLPERLPAGQPYLQPVRVRVDGPTDEGSVRLDLVEPVDGFDDDTGDDTAVIR